MWANWKPSRSGPFSVAIVWQPLFNPFQNEVHAGVLAELKSAGIKVVSDVSPSSPSDVPQQLQQLNQAIAKKPSAIIFEPISSPAAIPAVDAAGKAGIPVVGAWNAIDSTAAVSVGYNDVLQAAEAAAGVYHSIGDSGKVLEVHGIPGIAVDNDAFAGFKAAMQLCPNVSVAGAVTGNFSNPATQQAVTQFLATHPAGVQAVLQAGTMGLGVLQAYTKSGRTPVALGDLGATRATVAYAKAHPSFNLFGTNTPSHEIGTVIAQTAERILAGQGPKIDNLVTMPKLINQSTLSDFYQSGWTVTDPTDVAGPAGGFFPKSYFDSFFNNPDAK